MKRGVWHQFGDRSQTLVLEQLQHENGVGAVVSPTNLSFENAKTRSEQYRDLGADILLDTQFYEPTYENKLLASFDLGQFRQSASGLIKLSGPDLDQLARRLEALNRDLGTSAIVAPALVYEAGRTDIVDLNARLFAAAKAAADVLGIPTYATVVLGGSALASDAIAQEMLSYATSLPAAGYYYANELDERIPFDAELVFRLASFGLILACTGLPILHAYAGLTSLISLAFGADGVAIGHTHKQRHFSRDHWQEQTSQGGRGDTPARYFSASLWSTIVLPDETVRIRDLWNQVQSNSPFGPASQSDTTWPKWDSNKHLLFVLGKTLSRLCEERSARKCADSAIAHLRKAAALHSAIADRGVQVADDANRYQANWVRALNDLVDQKAPDFEYLKLIGK